MKYHGMIIKSKLTERRYLCVRKYYNNQHTIYYKTVRGISLPKATWNEEMIKTLLRAGDSEVEARYPVFRNNK